MPLPPGWAMRTSVEELRSFLKCFTYSRGTVPDSCAEVQKKYNIATELRDNIDILCNGPTYPIFLKKLIPVFMKLLEGPPVFMSTYMEHVSYALSLSWVMKRS